MRDLRHGLNSLNSDTGRLWTCFEKDVQYKYRHYTAKRDNTSNEQSSSSEIYVKRSFMSNFRSHEKVVQNMFYKMSCDSSFDGKIVFKVSGCTQYG